ncbi:MAG: hypothetical protein AAGK04_04745 [Planctomycetota bacterium]
MPPPTAGQRIDRLMESASRALEDTHYWKVERTAQQALELARQAGDWLRMARICLPLQEARRQMRQLAFDAPGRFLVSRAEDVIEPIQPGVYLFQPPMTGMDARMLRDAMRDREIPSAILAREPLTRSGHWPVVATGRQIVRARVAPPKGVEPDKTVMTRDRFTGDLRSPEFRAWFESASEAVGDRAILECKDMPAAERVDALLDRLDAISDHEKLQQALMSACEEAAKVPSLPTPRVGAPYAGRVPQA